MLWAALAINLSMFLVETASGLLAGSQALVADAIDFFRDAANYGVTLALLPLGLAWRMRAARFKGASMLLLGLFVAARSAWALTQGQPPQAVVMGAVGLLALAANVAVAMMLYAYRSSDLNMRSVWLCSRNDAIGNPAVLLAALGVFGTGSAWPDLLVAAVMSTLAIWGGWSILNEAGRTLKQPGLPASGSGAKVHSHWTKRGQKYQSLMRIFLIALIIVMLPVRGWMGDTMALSMAGIQRDAAAVQAPERQITGADEDCAGMSTASMAAMALTAEAEATAGDALSDSGHCESCANCQACSTVGLATDTVTTAAPALGQISPVGALPHFASADPQRGQKPPIS